MDKQHPHRVITQEEKADLAHAQLEEISRRLADARKILRRDWPHLTPRERSQHSRVVKELETQQASLWDELETS